MQCHLVVQPHFYRQSVYKMYVRPFVFEKMKIKVSPLPKSAQLLMASWLALVVASQPAMIRSAPGSVPKCRMHAANRLQISGQLFATVRDHPRPSL